MKRAWRGEACLAAMFLVATAVSSARADEPAEAKQDEAAQQIKALVAGDAFQRRDATSKLLELGQEAVEPLAKEAAEAKPAAMYHCFDVLARLLASENEATSTAAKTALDKLSQSENKSVALRAKSAIRLKEILGRRQAALAAAPALLAQINGGANQRVQIKIVNGDRTIEVQTGDEKVEIRDKNGKEIELKHTRPVDGKAKTDEYKAADLDDLKKKHPDAAKLYEKYAPVNGIVGGAGAQIQIQAGPGGFRAGPLRLTPTEFGPTLPGPRTIRAQLDDRKVEITDDDGRKIRVKITKTIDGKETTETFSADDLKELKAEHPDAAKLYEKYTGCKTE